MGNARIRAVGVLGGLLGAVLAAVPAARASFHFWGINEVYSNASGTIQFVEMATSSGFEQFLQFNQFKSNAQTLVFDDNFDESTANKTFLMATPGYDALTGVPEPDFVFPSDNFFSISGDTLTLVGAEGDGTHPPSLTFTGAQLPTDGVKSLSFNLSQNATNSPTNFAGTTGTVPEPAAAGVFGLLSIGITLTRRRQEM